MRSNGPPKRSENSPLEGHERKAKTETRESLGKNMAMGEDPIGSNMH